MSRKSGMARKIATVFVISASVVVLGSSQGLAAAPTAGITPATGLGAEQTVTATGSGFAGGDSVSVIQCTLPTDPTTISCNPAGRVTAVADTEGNFTTQLTVRVAYDGVNPATSEPTGPVDCKVAPGCAVLVGSQTDPSVYASPVPISFS